MDAHYALRGFMGHRLFGLSGRVGLRSARMGRRSYPQAAGRSAGSNHPALEGGGLNAGCTHASAEERDRLSFCGEGSRFL